MATIPRWIEELVEKVTARIVPVDYLPPLGCHVGHADGVWEITVFVGAVETFGGLNDGSHRPGRFTFDLRDFTELFDRVEAFGWQPLSMATDDELGPHLGVEGVCNGHSVWLRVLARSPEMIGASAVIDANQQTIAEAW